MSLELSPSNEIVPQQRKAPPSKVKQSKAKQSKAEQRKPLRSNADHYPLYFFLSFFF
jgi:hypothetical protein